MPDENKGTTTRGTSTTHGTATAETVAAPAPKEKGFAPIKPSDDDKNPVKVEVPKDAQEIAQEGTDLAAAGSEATGGDVPFAEAAPATANKRIWSLDADHNVNLRHGGPGSETNPDLVERSV